MKLFVVFAFIFVGYACADALPAIELPQDVADKVAPKATPVHPKDLVVDHEDVLPEERITNGWRANEGQIRYQAGLLFSGPQGGWWCGGSLIGEAWILTAAHCTNGAHSVTIYLGSTRRAQARWSVTVGNGNFRQHPHYNGGNLNNDISLIIHPVVVYSNFIYPVALPPFKWEHEQWVNHWATASGWGGWHGGSGLPDDLQYAYMQVIDNGACSRVYGGDVVRDTTICVSTPGGVSTCGGDSGGPLVVYGYDRLIGVTSFVAASGCQSGLPAGFARVSKHLDWIRGHTGITGDEVVMK